MLNTILLTLTVYMGLEALVLFLVYRKFQKSPNFYKAQFVKFLNIESNADALVNFDERLVGLEEKQDDEVNRLFSMVSDVESELSKTTLRTKRIKATLVNRGIITKKGSKCVFPIHRGSGRS